MAGGLFRSEKKQMRGAEWGVKEKRSGRAEVFLYALAVVRVSFAYYFFLVQNGAGNTISFLRVFKSGT